jgi:hypothetical protein
MSLEFDCVDFEFRMLASQKEMVRATNHVILTLDEIDARLDRVERMCAGVIGAIPHLREIRIGTWPERGANRGMGPILAQISTLEVLILENVMLSNAEFREIGVANPKLDTLFLDGSTPHLRQNVWRAYTHLERLVFGTHVKGTIHILPDARLFRLMPTLTTIERKYLK